MKSFILFSWKGLKLEYRLSHRITRAQSFSCLLPLPIAYSTAFYVQVLYKELNFEFSKNFYSILILGFIKSKLGTPIITTARDSSFSKFIPLRN